LASRLARVAEHPQAILLASVVIAVALNFWETRGQTLFQDEWSRFLYADGSLAELLRGHSGHLVVLHTVLYKAIFSSFGASYLPFRIVEALLLGTCGLLFYALARSRAGPWPCLVATLVLLFLGSAFEVTATPYGIVILLPIAFGLAALVCLERFRGDGDPLTCLLLVAAVASHSDGLAFLAGAAVLLALQSGRRFVARIWVVLVPALLYLAWFVWYRLTASGTTPEVVHLGNLAEVPSTLAQACSAGLSAISGFFGTSGPGNGVPFNLEVGYLLLGLLVVGAIWRVRSGSPLPREIWVPLALALTFWALLGMVASAQRPPTISRYLYTSAVFLLLILLELAGSIRATPRVIWLTVGALLVSLVPNVINLNDQARQIRDFATVERADLGAVELLRDEVPVASIPDLVRQRTIGVGGQGFRVPATTYFAAIDRYGSPAASPEEIASGAEAQKHAVDQVLLQGHDLTLSQPPAGRSGAGRNCRPATGAAETSGPSLRVPASGLEIRPQRSRSGVTVLARRFGTSFQRLKVPAGLGPLILRPGRSQQVRPWLVRVGGASVCPAA